MTSASSPHSVSQIHTLTIMVTVSTVMTGLVLLLLSALVMMKMKKRRRLAKKILPSTLFNVEKESLKIVDKKVESLNLGNLRTDVSSDDMKRTRSINTVTTQLSNQSTDSNQQTHENISENEAPVRRLPSEDCVPGVGRSQSDYSNFVNSNHSLRQFSQVV